jgi:hypothetical protein
MLVVPLLLLAMRKIQSGQHIQTRIIMVLFFLSQCMNIILVNKDVGSSHLENSDDTILSHLVLLPKLTTQNLGPSYLITETRDVLTSDLVVGWGRFARPNRSTMWVPIRLSSLMELYIHSLYVLVSKILYPSSIPLSIHSIYCGTHLSLYINISMCDLVLNDLLRRI